MTVLNEADALYLGSTLVDAVYLGSVRAWPPSPESSQHLLLLDGASPGYTGEQQLPDDSPTGRTDGLLGSTADAAADDPTWDPLGFWRFDGANGQILRWGQSGDWDVPDNTGEHTRVVAFRSSVAQPNFTRILGSNNWDLWVQGDNAVFRLNDGSTDVTRSRPVAFDGTWHVATMRVVGTDQKLRINGSETVATRPAGAINSTGWGFAVGSSGWSPGALPFTGDVRMVGVWDRHLSDAEVDALETLYGAPIPAESSGPYTGYILTGNTASPTTDEVAIHDILEAEGHTVGYYDITGTEANLPADAEFVVQPNNSAWIGSNWNLWEIEIPFFSLSKNNIYVQGLLPWSDSQSEGVRFDATGLWGQTVRYTDDTVLPWTGQSSPSTVDILTSDQWTNGAVAKAAVDSQTANGAEHFLSLGNDTDDSHSAGFYLPTGSTVTQPNATEANEVTHTSTAPFVGLFWDATFTNDLNADGEALIVAAFDKLMS